MEEARLDGWGAGGEREGDSLVVQHGSVGTARFLGVVSVGRSVCARRCRCVATRVCVSLAWTMQGQSRRRALLCATGAPSANGSAFRSIRLNVKTRNISRRFFLSSILPPPFARTVLPLSLRGRGHHVGRGALLPDDLETRRMEGLSRESNPIPKPVYSVSEGILFTRYARIRKILRLIRRLLGRGRYIECHRAIF